MDTCFPLLHPKAPPRESDGIATPNQWPASDNERVERRRRTGPDGKTGDGESGWGNGARSRRGGDARAEWGVTSKRWRRWSSCWGKRTERDLSLSWESEMRLNSQIKRTTSPPEIDNAASRKARSDIPDEEGSKTSLFPSNAGGGWEGTLLELLKFLNMPCSMNRLFPGRSLAEVVPTSPHPQQPVKESSSRHNLFSRRKQKHGFCAWFFFFFF